MNRRRSGHRGAAAEVERGHTAGRRFGRGEIERRRRGLRAAGAGRERTRECEGSTVVRHLAGRVDALLEERTHVELPGSGGDGRWQFAALVGTVRP